MAIDVFISYRRSDAGGHARTLYYRLRDAFGEARLFFDRSSIEPGDDFPAEIDAAVRECRVLLALIGPGWLVAGDDGKRRLDDPRDFVRREIALALAVGKRVIPVLLDEAKLPTERDLPAPLAGLLRRDVHEQHGKTYEYDAQLARLVELIAAVPGVAPPRPAGGAGSAGARGDTDGLSVLCDRSLQDDAAGEAVRAELRAGARRPIVLVLHGRTDEAHWAFVERLERFSLPRLLKGSAFAGGLKFAALTEALPADVDQAGFDRRLRSRLAERLDLPDADDDDALLAQMRRLKIGTLVAVLTWSASELTGDPALVLQRVSDYWARFPRLPERVLAGCIVCLKYDGAAGGGWVKRLFGGGGRADALRAAVERSRGTLGADPRLAWCVAGELPSVTVADLDRWVDEVRRLTGRFSVAEDRLQAIIGGDTRPMQQVLPALDALVAGH